MTKQGRNDPCACGSGKKFKQCCVSKPVQGISTQNLTQGLRSAWLYFESQRFDQVKEICQKIIKAVPAQIDAVHLLGLIALKDGDIEAAVSYLSNVVKRDPSKPQYVANLGFAYHEQGKLDLAITAYRKAIAMEPRFLDAHYNLHAALINTKNLDLSIASLEAVIQLNPQDADAIFMLGMLQDYQGNTKAAEAQFVKIQQGNALIASRLDAWQYFKSAVKGKLPPVTGSIATTFELATQAAKIKGSVLEFGVRHANSTRQLATLAKQDVHGFDSFEGIPEDWHDESRGSYSTSGVIPKVPNNIHLHAGWFDATLPKFLEANNEKVRLINIDCDIYSSTKTVLDLLAPRIMAGTVIIFDEYIGNQHWREDEFKAFQEAVITYAWKYKYLSFSFFTKQVALMIC
jgi:TPR repeat/Macrocin-O-methyltransferase (TylF)/SEC-C motif/Tetratricopeptide repeat